MSKRIQNILEELKTLTLLETSELVLKIEETFGIDASTLNSSPVMLSNEVISTKEEEKTEFNLMLDEVPKDKKIAILKVVRVLTGLGLKEAKELVETAPKQVQEKITKELALEGKKQIEEAGGKASIM
jgi:large subunit ribosomal protein L7/L12